MTKDPGCERIYDISRPISAALAGWPDDTPYRFEMLCRLRDGASVNLGSLEMSPHTGTHIDAPYHYDDCGATVGQLSLETYLGSASVVSVMGRAVISQDDIAARWQPAQRVLLRTAGWEEDACFPEQIPVIAADVPEWLRANGVLLLGVDLPSVDQIDSKDLPNHHALGRAGIAILEGLDLRGVPDGLYELIALPLRLSEADGCPVRAILRG
jgi:arylformamidase